MAPDCHLQGIKMSVYPYRAGANPAPTQINPKHEIVGVGLNPTRKVSIIVSSQLFCSRIMFEAFMKYLKTLCPIPCPFFSASPSRRVSASFPHALCHSQQFWLFQFLQCSFICCTVSEALPKVFPDGTNLLHLAIRVKSKCFLTPSLCFRLYKGFLLQVIELLARDPDLTYDFRCCLHNKRPTMRKIWGHLRFPSNPHVSRIVVARL